MANQPPGTRSRSARPTAVLAVALLVSLASASLAVADPGSLLIIGGGLKDDNAEIHRTLIDLAGGPEQAHFGVFPTASVSDFDARQKVKLLTTRYGLPAGAAEVIEITSDNASQAAFDPAIASRIRGCTGLFFCGGDQSRIARALLGPDGDGSLAWEAVRAVFDAGGVIAGTSAGAAVMSDPMLSSRGGMLDALDFGLASASYQRGAVLARGLGFFRDGLIDQHFGQRGRLARLARVLVERKIPLGFGIDEDTALLVRPDGTIAVLGSGGVTIVDASEAEGADGPLGFHADGLTLCYLERGDRFDPTAKTCAIDPRKTLIAVSDRITDADDTPDSIIDLSERLAVRQTITSGLARSSVDRCVGLFLRHGRMHDHGYRFTFARTDATQSYFGRLDGAGSYAVLDVRLDIDPVASAVEPAEALWPRDLDAAEARKAIVALVFRGIMACDEAHAFRPADPLTRAEFADLLARAASIRRRGPRPAIADVPEDAPFAREIAMLVASEVLFLDDAHAFRPSEPVTRQEVAAALARVRNRLGSIAEPPDSIEPPVSLADADRIAPIHRDAVFAALRTGLFTADDQTPFRPADPATREEIAVALAKFLGLPW